MGTYLTGSGKAILRNHSNNLG
jgi:hypothetical protein